MNFLKSTALCLFVLMAVSACWAQQKFPLRSGEWVATLPASGTNDKPIEFLYCLNDQLWTKALTQNPSCSIQNLNVTLVGVSYSMDCQFGKTAQVKGKVTLTFDGMTHMVGGGSIDTTINGKTTTSTSKTDYRWKGPTCSPNDMNLRQNRAH